MDWNEIFIDISVNWIIIVRNNFFLSEFICFNLPSLCKMKWKLNSDGKYLVCLTFALYNSVITIVYFGIVERRWAGKSLRLLSYLLPQFAYIRYFLWIYLLGVTFWFLKRLFTVFFLLLPLKQKDTAINFSPNLQNTKASLTEEIVLPSCIWGKSCGGKSG